MVDVVREEDLPELADGQLAVEHAFASHPQTGEPLLTIAVRGEQMAAMDAEAQKGINEAIAFHAHMSMQRSLQPSHAVHVEPEYETRRVKTYDPARGDSKKPDGEDEAPFWGFDEKVRINVPSDCPDCTRGLVAEVKDKPFLRCTQAVLKPDVQPCHAGCIVACGLPR